MKVTTYMVITETADQNRALEAFLMDLKIKFIPTKPTLEELESRLLPNQKNVWANLKNSLLEVENGTAQSTTWEDFKKELADDNSITHPI